MSNMSFKASILFLLIILLIPSVAALNAVPAYTSTCIDSSILEKVANITDRQDGTKILDSVQNVTCPYGCDQDRDICWKWPANALSGEYFILFEMIALITMFFAIWRTEATPNDVKVFDVFAPLIAMILFSLLALQGNNVIDLTTGEGIPMVMIVWLDYGLALLMLLFFFFNIFKFARSVTDEGSKL